MPAIDGDDRGNVEGDAAKAGGGLNRDPAAKNGDPSVNGTPASDPRFRWRRSRAS